MKAFRFLITIVSLGVLFTYAGCGNKGGATETTQDKQLGLLSKTWKVATVSLGGVDQSSTWTVPNFQLTIAGTKGATTFNYTCAGRPSLGPWPASGTWAFGADPLTQIVRDSGSADQLAMTYTVSATSLQVKFTYTGNGYSRVDNVSGSWEFNFTAN